METLAHKTKIVATIGPASQTPEILGQMIRAGMNIVPLSFSHGEFAGHSEVIENVRLASAEGDARWRSWRICLGRKWALELSVPLAPRGALWSRESN